MLKILAGFTRYSGEDTSAVSCISSVLVWPAVMCKNLLLGNFDCSDSGWGGTIIVTPWDLDWELWNRQVLTKEVENKMHNPLGCSPFVWMDAGAARLCSGSRRVPLSPGSSFQSQRWSKLEYNAWLAGVKPVFLVGAGSRPGWDLPQFGGAAPGSRSSRFCCSLAPVGRASMVFWWGSVSETLLRAYLNKRENTFYGSK